MSETTSRFPLKWTQAPMHGFGWPPLRESYKLEYRNDPLTRELQYRYVPDGPYHSGSGQIIGGQLTANAHTPGPWKATHSDPAEGVDCWWITANVLPSNGEKEICSVPSGYRSVEANAHLIAAAPELLAALRGIVADDDAGVSLEDQRARWNDRMAAAKAAIAKATASPIQSEGASK